MSDNGNLFYVVFDVQGEIYATIQADSAAEAQSRAEAMCVDTRFGLNLSDADVVEVQSIVSAGSGPVPVGV